MKHYFSLKFPETKKKILKLEIRLMKTDPCTIFHGH